MVTIDQFGFLSEECKFECDEFRIFPVDEFHKLVEEIKAEVYRDGFLYPHYDTKTHLYKLPATHNIELKQNNFSLGKRELRLGIIGFIMHLIGYIYGRRLQFHDWWFDSRISFNGQHNIRVSKEGFKRFFAISLAKFDSWNDNSKKFFINILYMHNRVPTYEWDWERFAVEYMVLDASWRFSGLKGKNHAERINKLCNEYGLYQDDKEIKRIIELRNDLFHEALWGKGHPGTSRCAEDFCAGYNLRRLNHRVIPAILGYKSEYIKSNWTNIGCHKFD